MANAPASTSSSALNPFGLDLSAIPNPLAAASAGTAKSLPDYLVDAFQRSVLFLELLRERGNQQEEITSRPMATVLRFDHEVLVSGRSLPRPINYSLSRIVPPAGVTIDPRKRPVVVVDPRAGQGPGIGGFKAESEIGDALNAGHPVYFIAFRRDPRAGPAIPRRRRRAGDVLREGRRTASRLAAPVRDRQLPGRLPDADGRHAAARPVRALPASPARRCRTGRACAARTRCATPAACSAAAGSPR